MVIQQKRSPPQRAFVLHSYPYKESSLIVDVFTIDNGRMAMVAKGAKRPGSNLRGALLSLQPIEVVFTGRGEVKSMIQAVWMPGQPWLTGRALMCGLYLNELVMKLLPREDAHPLLFESYAATLLTLAASDEQSAILREFETQLLAELGYGLQLEHEARSQAAIRDDVLYRYDPLAGPAREGTGVLVSGRVLIALRKGMFETAQLAAESRDFVRAMIQFHLERRNLKSSNVMHDLHALSERLDAKPTAQRKAKRVAALNETNEGVTP